MKEIVVSVCAKTAKELVIQIKHAEEFADVIEVRFDCLEPDEIQKSFASLNSTKPLLFTFRPVAQGGHADVEIEWRFTFWTAFVVNNAAIQKHNTWLDLEYDLIGQVQKSDIPMTIHSFHDFSGAPDDIEEVYEHLAGGDAAAKIAIQTDDISDGLALWKLLKKAKSENKQLVPIAMGEAGKWTRILGLAYGAPMTYAALESGKEVAPGQISAEELRDVYRVKELTEKTDIFGIIGDPVKFSLSPYMQNAAFKAAGKDAVFVPFEVQDLDSFITRFLPESGLNIRGLSVTQPHKQAVMKYLDEIDETAQKIGAVNTLKIVDGKLHGFNTDAPGFIAPLTQRAGNLSGKRAAVLGAGGAARACIHALKQNGAQVTVFARDLAKAKPLAAEFGVDLQLLSDEAFSGFDLVVNATPLGMKGKFEGQSPSTPGQLKGVPVVYDLVYNPEETPFLQAARTAGVPTVIGGLEMLVAQGAEQFRIWTGGDAPVEVMKAALRERLK